MVIEPAKGEYKHVFGGLDDVAVYSHTNKIGNLLQINPFVFPYQHVDVLEHIKRIVGIFNACWSLYAAMPSILEHSIITAYEKCGWDVDASEHKFEKPIFPSVDDVVVCVKDYIDRSDYSADTKGDYKAAIEKRLQDLCEGMFDKMFNRGSISDEDLFNNNTIIDLSRTGSPETNALIMGFLVIKLNEFRMSEGGMNKPLRHVTVLEEAHNLLRKVSTTQSMETANVAGKSVEMITNSIAEMRTYGESFIIVDQSPSLLDSAAIRNTNTKIVLSLPDIEDRKVAGGSMSLHDDQIDEIARQNQGEAIVYQNHWEEPVQCKVDLFEEYEKDFVYNKSTTFCKKANRVYKKEIVEFLLHPYLNKGFDINSLITIIRETEIPNAIKFSLMDLIEEYKSTNELKIWKDYNFADLAFILKQYLNLDSEYNKITSQYTNMKQVRIKLDVILKERFKNDLYRAFLYYVEMCYVRNNALYEDWRKTF
jgi:arsenate reductase-like glutaredoxin family protein